MYCDQCGNKLPEHAKKCDKCGAIIDYEIAQPNDTVARTQTNQLFSVKRIILLAIVVLGAVAIGAIASSSSRPQDSSEATDTPIEDIDDTLPDDPISKDDVETDTSQTAIMESETAPAETVVSPSPIDVDITEGFWISDGPRLIMTRIYRFLDDGSFSYVLASGGMPSEGKYEFMDGILYLYEENRDHAEYYYDPSGFWISTTTEKWITTDGSGMFFTEFIIDENGNEIPANAKVVPDDLKHYTDTIFADSIYDYIPEEWSGGIQEEVPIPTYSISIAPDLPAHQADWQLQSVYSSPDEVRYMSYKIEDEYSKNVVFTFSLPFYPDDELIAAFYINDEITLLHEDSELLIAEIWTGPGDFTVLLYNVKNRNMVMLPFGLYTVLNEDYMLKHELNFTIEDPNSLSLYTTKGEHVIDLIENCYSLVFDASDDNVYYAFGLPETFPFGENPCPHEVWRYNLTSEEREKIYSMECYYIWSFEDGYLEFVTTADGQTEIISIMQ